MASLLSMGAGASEGLDKYLVRLMQEEQMARAQQNADRDFGLRERTLGENTKFRELQQEQLQQQRQMAADAQERDDIRQGYAQVPGGTVIDPANYDRVIKLRALPAERFDVQAAPDQEAVAEGVPPSLAENDPSARGLIKLRPTPTEVAAEERNNRETAGSFGTPNFMLEGKPIVARRDNHTGRIIYQGEDITDDPRLKPYVGPDRAILATSEGLLPRPEVAAKAGRGDPAQPPVTSATRTMQEGAAMLKPHIEDAQAMATELDNKGLFGPVMSRVRQALTKAGTIDQFSQMVMSDPEMQNDELAGRFATTLGLLASGAGRVHGGARGGGSPTMYAQFKSLLSDASSLKMFLGRLGALNDFMSGYEEGPTAPKRDNGGLPTVGGTFQGGKVLSITPVTEP